MVTTKYHFGSLLSPFFAVFKKEKKTLVGLIGLWEYPGDLVHLFISVELPYEPKINTRPLWLSNLKLNNQKIKKDRED